MSRATCQQPLATTKTAASFLSIVIPAYNAERTIARAVQSVRAQTLQSLDIWVVNDGSTDQTGAIVDALAREDKRVHVIHQRNRRPYQARLTALKCITTPYFTFLDADDWIEPECYARVLEWMQMNDLDVAAFDMFDRALPRVAEECFLTPEAIDKGVIYPLLVKGSPLPYTCNKIYRHHYDFSTFEALSIHTFDDMILNLNLLRDVKRVGVLHEPFYHYEVTEHSSVSQYSQQKLNDFIAAMHYRQVALAKWYNIPADAAEHTFWVIRNARVALVLIATAPGIPWDERHRLAKALLTLPEVSSALTIAKGASARLLRWARSMPTMTFLLLRPLRSLWHCLPLRFRLRA